MRFLGTSSNYSSERDTMYPLQSSLSKGGLVAGLLAGIVTLSPLAGFAVAVAFCVAGAVWRRDSLPVLVFCLLYQWLFIVSGHFFERFFGYFPANVPLGRLEYAILLSLLGLAAIALGIRLVPPSRSTTIDHRGRDFDSHLETYDPKALFWFVVGLFSVNWFLETFPLATLFNAAQAVHNLLLFRYLFLLLLWMTVLQKAKGYQYATFAFVFVLLPELTSSMAKFKDIMFMLLIVLMSAWKPWSHEPFDRNRNIRITAAVIAVSFAIVACGLLWTGGVKHDWRSAIRAGQIQGSPVDKIEQFADRLNHAVGHFNTEDASLGLVSRISSSTAYFSRVLNNVPDLVPHEDGSLTWRAIRHISMPRILFPEKKNLGGDSWLVRRYAGLNVAGDESQTSIGLGYMVEMYIDFGVPGMFLPLVLLGMLIGVIHRVIIKISPSRSLAEAAMTALLVQNFIGYESHFTKQLGGLCQTALIFTVVLAFAGPTIHALLTGSVGANRKGLSTRFASTRQ